MTQAVCSSCNQAKATLRARQSKLYKTMTINMCEACIESGMEPKFLIKLYGHENGLEAIRPYLDKKLYVGSEILAKEL